MTIGSRRHEVAAPSGPMSVVTWPESAAEPTIVLLHSMGLDAASFELVAEALGESTCLAAIDLWGHGSTPMRRPIDLEKAADDVAAVISTLSKSAVVLAGVSYGGVLAQLVAARHPEVVGQLVLANTFVNWPGSTVRLEDHRAAWRAAGGDEAWYLKRVEGAFVPGVSQRARELYLDAARQNSGDDFFESVGGVYSAVLDDIWPSISVPVTIVTGESESRIPQAVTDHLVEISGVGRAVVIPAANHLTYLENPRDFAAVLSGLIPAKASS